MKILYLYNKENWALHNVGKLWFTNLSTNISIEMVDYHKLQERDFYKYDYVWFSLYIYEKFNYDPDKSIITIHDPIELYPQEKSWHSRGIESSKIKLLRALKNLNVISKEIKNILASYGISAVQIPTASLLPFRSESKLHDSQNCRLLSVTNEYPRKDIPLMRKIQSAMVANGINFNIKLGDEILPQNEYIRLLDTHEIYICTSFQEGGPLPAMDAMARGLAVLTTPVGQIQELITNGFNGYICNTEDKFIEKALLLSRDKEHLRRLRLYSLKSIKELRDRSKIYKSVNQFLNKLD